MMTTYALATIHRTALERAGLWDAVPGNVKAQWSQRHYNNKAAVRAAEGTEADAFAWVVRQVEKARRGQGIGSGVKANGETAGDFLDRMIAAQEASKDS